MTCDFFHAATWVAGSIGIALAFRTASGAMLFSVLRILKDSSSLSFERETVAKR